MPHVRTAPFRRANDQRVEITGWFVQGQDDATEPLSDALPDWDPATLFRARVTLTVDASGVAEDCDLLPESHVRISLLWRSRGGSELRGPGSRLDLRCADGRQLLTLGVDVPGEQLAGSVELAVVVTATAASRPNGPLAPNRPGAVLWSTARTVRIEGSGSRFPMEWADFAASPTLPDGAAWYLSWEPDDLQESFAGGVRLYLNRKHPLLNRIAEGVASDELERVLFETLFFDAGRALFLGALRNDDFVREPDAFGEDSVGATIRRSLNVYFPGERVETLANLLRVQPGRFEALLQERLALFQRFA